MTTTTTAAEDSLTAIGEIVELLHRASELAWQDTATDSPRMSLGLGILLLHAQASTLLPVDHQFPAARGDGRSVVHLLREAEHRSRTLPLHRPDMAGLSDVAVALCDLIREAGHLDC